MNKSPEDALEFMKNNAKALAKAKAERIYLDEYRKSLKAMLFQKAPSGTIADRESWAYANEDYISNLEGLKIAVEEEERLKWLMIAAQATVEVWRSREASNRMIDRGHQ